MKIDLSNIDREGWNVNEHDIAGETCFLVYPKDMGATWTRDNFHLRSSVWNSNGELISASLPKFFNYTEKPDLYSNPDHHNDWEAMEKLDGSTLIVSKYKGEILVRTRGTVDASRLELSGHEIKELKEKYTRVFDFKGVRKDTADYSLIFEWVTPANQIVIKYPHSDILLIGMIWHDDYRLATQVQLDALALELGVRRPRLFKFNSLKEMVSTVSQFDDMEGVCLYYNNGQNIVKLKGDWYLKCHKLKSILGSVSNVLDVYIDQCGRDKDFQFVHAYITEKFDFELANQCADILMKIEAAIKLFNERLAAINSYVESTLKPVLVKNGMAGRAKCAKLIFEHDKVNSSLYFNALDARPVPDDKLKKLLLEQIG